MCCFPSRVSRNQTQSFWNLIFFFKKLTLVNGTKKGPWCVSGPEVAIRLFLTQQCCNLFLLNSKASVTAALRFALCREKSFSRSANLGLAATHFTCRLNIWTGGRTDSSFRLTSSVSAIVVSLSQITSSIQKRSASYFYPQLPFAHMQKESNW